MTHAYLYLVFERRNISGIQNLRGYILTTNVIEIEGLLFLGFGQMPARKFFPTSDVTRVLTLVEKFSARALKMELFSGKILSAPGS